MTFSVKKGQQIVVTKQPTWYSSKIAIKQHALQCSNRGIESEVKVLNNKVRIGDKLKIMQSFNCTIKK
jgi:hypothetical protein